MMGVEGIERGTKNMRVGKEVKVIVGSFDHVLYYLKMLDDVLEGSS